MCRDTETDVCPNLHGHWRRRQSLRRCRITPSASPTACLAHDHDVPVTVRTVLPRAFKWYVANTQRISIHVSTEIDVSTSSVGVGVVGVGVVGVGVVGASDGIGVGTGGGAEIDGGAASADKRRCSCFGSFCSGPFGIRPSPCLTSVRHAAEYAVAH